MMGKRPIRVSGGPLQRKRWKERGVPPEIVRDILARLRTNLTLLTNEEWEGLARDFASLLAHLLPGRGKWSQKDFRTEYFVLNARWGSSSWRRSALYLGEQLAALLPRSRGRPDARSDLQRVLETIPSTGKVVEEARRLKVEEPLLSSKMAVSSALQKLGYDSNSVDSQFFLNVARRVSDKPRKR
jgi:hypothetical protein